MKQIILIDTGRKEYSEAWELQKSLVQDCQLNTQNNYLVLTEHPPVITYGKSSKEGNLITDKKMLESLGISLSETDRGGDITFHGPGQIVGYPIFNLNNFKKDINWYLRSLEEVIIQTLSAFGIEGTRIPKLTGVWVGNNKICAIGVKITRWVTMHGFALNVSTDLSYFNHIVPCGISDKGVTSISEILHKEISLDDVKEKLTSNFKMVFHIQIEEFKN